MSLDDILMLLLALVTGALLFVGLAQALEGRPRRRPARRSPHLPVGRRSFSAEERVLEHRARGARPAGSSPFATPPPPPVLEAPPPSWPLAEPTSAPPGLPLMTVSMAAPAEAEGPVPEQIALLDVVPSVEPAGASPSPEPVATRLEPSPSTVSPVTPRRVAMAAPVEETTVATEPVTHAQEETMVTVPAAVVPMAVVSMDVAAPLESARPESTPAVSPEDMPEAGVAPSPPTLSPALVAECARLLKAGRPGELRALAEPLLKGRGRGRARTPASYDRALLWCLVGLALREEGDETGLRAAFEQGVRALPKTDAGRPDPAVLALTEALGSQLVTLGEATPDASGASLATLRLSVGLLRGVAACEPGQAAGPPEAEEAEARGGDELPPWGKALRAHLAVERARDALANTCERKVTALLDRGERAGAQRWIQEVAGWDELGVRLSDLEEPYWKAVTADVTRLTTEALESTDDLAAAVRILEGAEGIVRELPASASHQMNELRRRLWWSYTKLGVQRMEGGDEGAALELLYHALRLSEGDADRGTETRQCLAQGLDAMAARASDAISERLRAGDHTVAEAAGQALCRAIDRALAEGVSQDELSGALGKRQHVMGLIAQADAR